jgi:hypothetical protein
MTKQRLLVWGLLIGLLVLPAGILAQEDRCPALVEEALAIVDDACTGLGRNQACYGHTLVTVTRFDGAPVEDFVEGGDITDVTQMASLTTAPLDVSENIWGIALLALQANLPGTLPGQNVTFIVYGDAELVSAVPPEVQASPPSVLNAQATRIVNVRSGPGTGYAVIGALSSSTKVKVSGRNAAGDWLFTAFEGNSAWVYAPLLTIDGDMDMLTIVDADAGVESAYTAPMQAFRFTSGISQSACEEAPRDGLLVQAPTDTTVRFMINSVEIEVGSTALLFAEDDMVSVNTFDGMVNVTAANETQTAEPGFQVSAAANIPPSKPEPYDYEAVRTAPVNLLPEPVSIPVSVPGNSDWVDSGISMTERQMFTVTATGIVNVWTDCETQKYEVGLDNFDCSSSVVGPNGGEPRWLNGQILAIGESRSAFPMPDAVLHSLIGRIGDSGEMFFIGEGGTFTANATGTLQFRVNDVDDMSNNDGAFVVIVALADENK